MRFYNLMQVKAWFEKGYGLSHYFFKAAAVVGIAANEALLTFYMCVAYAIFCFILGFVFYHYGFINAEIEVENNYNHFVKQTQKGIP